MAYYVWEAGSVSGTWYPIKKLHYGQSPRKYGYFRKSNTTARVQQRWSAQRYTLWDTTLSSHSYDIIFRFSPSIWIVAGKLSFTHSYLSSEVWTMDPTEGKRPQKQSQPRGTVWNRCPFHTARDVWKPEVPRSGRCVALLATRRPYSVRFVAALASLGDIRSLVTGHQLAAYVWLSNSYICVMKSAYFSGKRDRNVIRFATVKCQFSLVS